jgi:hypothetical protein
VPNKLDASNRRKLLSKLVLLSQHRETVGHYIGHRSSEISATKRINN